MNQLILFAALSLFPASRLPAADDCAKSADACRPRPAQLTPFMAELKKAEKTPEPAQEPAPKRSIKVPEAAAAPKTPEAAPAETARPEATAKKEVFSKPGWLAAAAAFLAGLYYFLKESGKRKRRK